MTGTVAFILSKGAAAKYTDLKLGSIVTNVTYKGGVASPDDLPENPQLGDEYSVGTMGLYVWNGTVWQMATTQGPQGETGDSGVYIGSTAPTDPDVNVWIQEASTGYQTHRFQLIFDDSTTFTFDTDVREITGV